MRRFLIILFVFSIPFFIAIINFKVNYNITGGDLNRVAKLPVPKNYREKFKDDLNQKKYFQDLSKIDLNKQQEYKYLVIGDSFSNQGSFGYNNFLARLDSSKVLYLDKNLFDIKGIRDPVQALNNLLNGDLFEKLNIEYVILQSVEREFIKRTININLETNILIKDLINEKINNKKINQKSEENNIKHFFKDLRKYIKNTILYNFDDRAFNSTVVVKNTKNKLFSLDEKKIFFYIGDVERINLVNSINVGILNSELNSFSEKLKHLNIKLVVLPSPDKYDLYYDYIENNRYPKNSFYELIRKEKKKYIFIDSKHQLKKLIDIGVKDVYFADDTHWSPIASKEIAKSIIKVTN